MIRFIFYSNFLNPHQYPIGEELFRFTGGRYRFIETEKMPDAFHRGGYPDYSGTPWLIRAWESQKESDMAERMALDADV